MEIRDKRVLITGASRGIGKVLAERFAAEGAKLALVARSEGPLKELVEKHGGHAYAVDLGDPAAVDGLIERVEADGPIDVLVNNAGISNIDYVLDQSPESIEAIFRVNLLSPIHLCQQVIPGMLERGGGCIVNMASVAAVVTPPGLVHYGSSKAGLAHYTAGLRMDLLRLPVHLALVQIGSTATEMDDATQAYPPYKALRRGKAVKDVRFPIEHVADGVIDAIRKEKPHVVLPKNLKLLTTLVEIPRAFMRLAFRKTSPRP